MTLLFRCSFWGFLGFFLWFYSSLLFISLSFFCFITGVQRGRGPGFSLLKSKDGQARLHGMYSLGFTGFKKKLLDGDVKSMGMRLTMTMQSQQR